MNKTTNGTTSSIIVMCQFLLIFLVKKRLQNFSSLYFFSFKLYRRQFSAFKVFFFLLKSILELPCISLKKRKCEAKKKRLLQLLFSCLVVKIHDIISYFNNRWFSLILYLKWILFIWCQLFYFILAPKKSRKNIKGSNY